jgi:hypothetical protein
MTKLSTDIYLAPIDIPPVEVEALTDASGHLLRLPDGYRWAGTLRDDSDGMAHWERSSHGEWLSIHPAHSFGEVASDRHFQLLAVTHEFPPGMRSASVRAKLGLPEEHS